MAKAILVMDMPERCGDCSLHGWECGDMVCMPMWRKPINAPNKESWCPLIPAIGYIEAKGNMISWEEDGDVD